jgi:hypothetical protein
MSKVTKTISFTISHSDSCILLDSHLVTSPNTSIFGPTCFCSLFSVWTRSQFDFLLRSKALVKVQSQGQCQTPGGCFTVGIQSPGCICNLNCADSIHQHRESTRPRHHHQKLLICPAQINPINSVQWRKKEKTMII